MEEACIAYREDYIIDNAEHEGKCTACECDLDGSVCHIKCEDSCEVCNENYNGSNNENPAGSVSSCLVTTEERTFSLENGVKIQNCVRGTAGPDRGKTLCDSVVLPTETGESSAASSSSSLWEEMTLNGEACRTPRLCGSSKLDPRAIYDCSNVDGLSYVDECNHDSMYFGFLGRVWQRHGEWHEYDTTGRCLFGELAGDSSSESSSLPSGDDDDDSSDDVLEPGASIGIAVAAAAVALVAIVCFCRAFTTGSDGTPAVAPDNSSAPAAASGLKTVSEEIHREDHEATENTEV